MIDKPIILPRISMSLKGDDVVMKQFNKLVIGKELRRDINKSLYRAAAIVRDDARIMAAMVQPRRKNKRLSKTLWKQIQIVRHRENKENGNFNISVVSKAPHAHLVELGTGPRYRKVKAKDRGQRRHVMISMGELGVRRGYTGIMPPKPYLEPAIKINLKRCEEIILQGSKQGLEIR